MGIRNRPGAIAGIFLAAGALICSSACLTSGLISRANARHDFYRPLVRISRAWLTPDSVFIAIDTQSPSDQAPQSIVVRAPFTLTAFAITSANAPARMVDGVLVHHLSTDIMRASVAVPVDATPLAIEEFSTSDLGEIAAGAGVLAAGVHVFDITYLPDVPADGTFESGPGHPAIGGPVLGIVTVGDDGSTTTLLVADIHEKTTHHRGWYLLTPFTVLGDIIASPVYLVMWLVAPKY